MDEEVSCVWLIVFFRLGNKIYIIFFVLYLVVWYYLIFKLKFVNIFFNLNLLMSIFFVDLWYFRVNFKDIWLDKI